MHFVDHFVHFVDNSNQSFDDFFGWKKFAIKNEKGIKWLLMMKDSPMLSTIQEIQFMDFGKQFTHNSSIKQEIFPRLDDMESFINLITLVCYGRE